MELTLKDSSKNIGVTEQQYQKMVTTVRRRHFPTINDAQAEKAEAAVFLAEARFFTQGNFTVAVLVLGEKFFVGATKRNKKDRSKPVFGKMTALSRAVQGALRHYISEFATTPVALDVEVNALPKVFAGEPKNGDIPRTMEDVARSIVYPNG